MKHNFIPHLILLTVSVTLTQFSFGQSQSVGIFDGHGDVGTSVKPGSATFIPATRKYVISGIIKKIRTDYNIIRTSFSYWRIQGC